MDMQPAKAEEMDAFDRYVELAGLYFRRYVRHLIRWLPPVIGFLLFLTYFARNHFYPSFDLFQFSSLLLSAAAIGFSFVAALTVGVTAPGLVLVHWFANDKRYKGLLRHRAGTERQKDKYAWLLVLLCFVLPFAGSTLVSAALILLIKTSAIIPYLIAPVLIALIFGIILQVRFALPKWSFLHFLWAGSLALLLVNALAMGVLSYTSTLGWVPAAFQPAAVTLTMLVVSTLVGFITPAAFGSFKTSLSFCTPLALVFAAYSGALSTMPERVMSWLGLGSYKASEIVLDAEYCQHNAPESLKLNEHCVITDAQVVWSLGESLVVRIKGEKEIQAQIPARYVKAIMQTVD
ncbi:hypothetical protein ACNFBT_11690 [Pseudomonas sp. NY15181]|uniref:hypothetical protein n=1 Tax=Pseudomonas sp. NY15181 TaxID=3400349 RepID=UPI003A89EB23